MKYISILISLVVFCVFLSGQEEISLLKIDPPDPQMVKKRSVMIDTNDVLKIVDVSAVKKDKVNIEFATISDYVIARLGKIEKGKISWSSKPDSQGGMVLKFGKSEYAGLLEKIRAEQPRPGYQIILSEEKTNAVLSSFELTFKAFPNLIVEFEYPVNVTPGEIITDKIRIKIRNAGSAASAGFDLDFVLGKSFDITAKRYGPSESKEGVVLLQNGRLRIGKMEPGGTEELKPPDGLKLPDELESGRYYLGAIADSGGEIAELEKGDNVFKGFILVSSKVPSRISAKFKGTVLTYITKTFETAVVNNDMDISSNDEWRKCQIRPYIFHLKHISWKDFFWEVNTDEKMVWKLTGAKFCQRGSGGKADQLNIRVVQEGGSTETPPSRFRLYVNETEVIYEPEEKNFSILLAGCNTIYLPFWKSCRTDESGFHFKFATWDNEVWELDPKKKIFRLIPMERMCRKSETGKDLEAMIDIVTDN